MHHAYDTLAAGQLYRRILKLDPDLADFHSDLGAFLGRQRRLAEVEAEAEAKEQYRIILARRPAHVQARVLLGGILSDRGDLQVAEREARRHRDAARPRGAPEARAQLLLAECYRKRGENGKAVVAEARVRALARTR
jgi:tetratricopeptide (TPR) repeat protein